MDGFDEQLFIPKEWLVILDAHTSTPYLVKFHSSPVDLTCAIMVTDTRKTWAEALSSNHFARRWRDCNNQTESSPLDDDQEEAWRTRSLDLLSSAHTLAGVSELSFEVVASKFGDFAFQLECSVFKWRWETLFVGYKTSADILSRHLIMPLISVNHLAFSSPDPVGDISPTDLEKNIDKVARTARRTLDTHVKNALSKPRLATTIRRITAVFNFISDPPNISTDTNPPLLASLPEPSLKVKGSSERFKTTRSLTPNLNDRRDTSGNTKGEHIAPAKPPSQIYHHAADSGSATEPEDDPLVLKPSPGPGADQRLDVRMRSPTPSREAGGARNRSITRALPSDTDSSPVRPIKKSKPRAPSSDEDSEEERRKLVAQIKSGTASAPALRQPMKRGGKRF